MLDGEDDWERALLTRKDEHHPVAALRGTLTIPGGSLEPGEPPFDGCVRELYEELCATSIADELARRLAHHGHHELSFTDGERTWTYGLDVFVARAPERAVFDRWMRGIVGPPGLSEARPVVCERGEVRALLAEHAFGAGHEHVLAQIV